MRVEELDQFHAREFEKRFSRHLARVRERYPLPESRILIPGRRKGERARQRRAPAYDAALEARELDVVDFFLRRTENERPDSDKLAFRTFELQEVGFLCRKRWVLKRYASRQGAHWVVIPAP